MDKDVSLSKDKEEKHTASVEKESIEIILKIELSVTCKNG